MCYSDGRCDGIRSICDTTHEKSMDPPKQSRQEGGTKSVRAYLQHGSGAGSLDDRRQARGPDHRRSTAWLLVQWSAPAHASALLPAGRRQSPSPPSSTQNWEIIIVSNKNTYLRMDYEATTRHNALEHMLLDVSAEPTDLPLSLLEDITKCFSDDQQIGSGGFAVVYKGILENGIVAVKRLSRTFDIHENKFHKEVECLMKDRHKNIVRFLGYCSDTQGKIVDYEGKLVMADVRNWLLCFEYVPNGSLEKYITDASCGLEWRERYQIIKGICRGLCHLHEKCILHLDLKPANILLDDHMVPKIADFGLSRCLDKEQTRVFTSHLCGSQGYLAPEFYCGQIAFASDIYSLGVIIVELLTGKKGYSEDENVVESWMNRLETSDEKNIHLEQVRVCTKLGMQCMNVDPKKRPVASHIMHMLDETESAISSSSHDSSSSPAHMVWVRERSTEWWDRLKDPSCPDAEFRYAFRMSRFTFIRLCDDLSDVVAEENDIPVHQCVAVCLWRLREVSRRFGLGISTCGDIFLQVCAAITAVLLPQTVIWSLEPPTDDRFQIVGAVRVDHVPISPPKEHTAEYYNHRLSMRNNEASYSICVQAVVNTDGTFMDVCIGLPGSLSDAYVLKRSALHASCEAGMLGKCRLVGSVSYQLTDWMLVPYRHQNLIDVGAALLQRACGRHTGSCAGRVREAQGAVALHAAPPGADAARPS